MAMENSLAVGLLSGDLTDCMEVDVCVSTIHRSKDLRKGALSASILHSGGVALQKEIDPVNQGKELNHGQVVMTTSGKIKNCRRVMFICLPRWREGNQRILRDSVKECLNLANLNGFESILIPPLATGGLGYPPEVVAQALMEAMVFFRSQHSDSAVKMVYVCINGEDPETKSKFVQTLQRCLTEADDHSLDEAFRSDPDSAGTSKTGTKTTCSGSDKTHDGKTSSSTSGQGTKTNMPNINRNNLLGTFLPWSGKHYIFVYKLEPVIDPGRGQVGVSAYIGVDIQRKCEVM